MSGVLARRSPVHCVSIAGHFRVAPFTIYYCPMTPSPDKTLDDRAKRWNRIHSTPNAVHLEWVRIIESSVFKPQRIDLDRAVALSGVHGSGKTLLLRMIEAAFGYATYLDIPPRINASSSQYKPWWDEAHVRGVLEVAVRVDKERITRTIDLAAGPETRRDAWPWEILQEWWPDYVSPIVAINEIGILYNSSLPYDIDKLRESRSMVMSPRDREGLRAILGRRFDSVMAYEVNLNSPTEEEYSIPFFVAKSGLNEVNGLEFSLGELWVSFLFWFLLRQAKAGSVVLIDEPEAFIAERGHRSLVDEIARIGLQRDLQIILATHSASMLSRFPVQKMRLFSGPAGMVTVTPPSSMVQLRDSVGIATPTRAIVLVEDQMAAAALKAVLADNDLALAREVDVVPVGGKDEVLNGCRVLRMSRRIPIFGVLDGDLRDTAPNPYSADRVFFLPGSGSPEDELLNASSDDPGTLGMLLRRSPQDIQAVISDLRHLDHQYFLPEIARRIGHDENAVCQAMITLWLGRPETSTAAAVLTQQIRAALSTTI